MVQEINENKHSKFVDFLLEKSSKPDKKPTPYNHEGIDEKKIEELSKEIQNKGSTRKKEEKQI